MLLPKFALEDLAIGSGSIIGKDNIEEFFNYISKHEDIEDKSIAALAPNYEIAAASLVHMLETRFVSLNPFIQFLFLKLKEEENVENREFILETLLKEFHDVAREAKKVFERFNMLGSSVDVVGISDKTKPKEEFKIPIPFKLVGMHGAFEKNFDWIAPKNLFDESSRPKRDEKGSSKTHLDEIPFIVEEFASMNVNALKILDSSCFLCLTKRR